MHLFRSDCNVERDDLSPEARRVGVSHGLGNKPIRPEMPVAPSYSVKETP